MQTSLELLTNRAYYEESRSRRPKTIILAAVHQKKNQNMIIPNATVEKIGGWIVAGEAALATAPMPMTSGRDSPIVELMHWKNAVLATDGKGVSCRSWRLESII